MEIKKKRIPDKKDNRFIGLDKINKLHYLASDGISVCGKELFEIKDIEITAHINNIICLECKVMLCYTENKYKIIKRRGDCSCSCIILSSLSIESDKIRFKEKQYVTCPLCGKSVIMRLSGDKI